MRAVSTFTILALGLPACAPEGDGGSAPGPIPGYELALAAQDKAKDVAPAPVVIEVNAEQLNRMIDTADVRLIDVRTKAEFDEGHIEGAELIPVDSFNPETLDLSDDRPIVFYCRSGRRSEVAARRFSEHFGKPATHMASGITGWREAGFGTVTPD